MYKISQTGNKYYYTLTQSCKAFWKDVQLILWNSDHERHLVLMHRNIGEFFL